MRNIFFKTKIVLIALGALLGALSAGAQETAASQTSVGYNELEIILVSVMGLLAFVIWMLGRVLVVLGKQVVIKGKASKTLPVVIVAVLLLTDQFSFAQDSAPAEAVRVVSNYGGLSATVFYILVSVLIIEIIIIFFLIIMIQQFSAELLPQKKRMFSTESKLKIWWNSLGKKLTNAVALEHEEDVVMDHEYDGIRELDNALPPWWKYGFYITICFAAFYLFYYSAGHGENPTQEYNAEMAKAKIEKENYEANNKDKIDENNIAMADAAGLAAAKGIFTTKCFACHGKLGEGGAGPNLTDDYWLHKGSLNDVYQSIKHGYPDKGMQAWSAVYTPKEISYLASYVKTLHGTHPPNAKEAQGDLYKGASAGASPGKTAVDSAIKK